MTSFLDRLRGRPVAKKAVYGDNWLTAVQQDVPLSMYARDPRQQAAQLLSVYGVGWFNKAGRKISADVAGLTPTLAYEDEEGDNAEQIVAPANNVPFDRLDPLEQFLRLMERPNPWMSGKQLRQKTQIDLDFVGRTVWWMAGVSSGSLPIELYRISPARMEHVLNAENEIVGWVMDRTGTNPGIPFAAEEILPFSNVATDDLPWTGMGVVQAIYAQVPLSSLIAKHTADILTTGGRMAGMIWPKDRALGEDEFQDAQKAWRNVTSDPNAARRLLVFPEPMEYSAGAATPVELGIPDLAALSRDEILTAFPISPHMLQVPLASGLNSGDSLRHVREEYWQGTIHERGELMEETIQVGMIPLYERAVNRPLDFDLEEPNLDDASAVIEKVAALGGLVEWGFDPKDAISAVGLDHIKWTSLPTSKDPNAPPPVPVVAPPPQELSANVGVNKRGINDTVTQPVVGKARPVIKAIAARREYVVGVELPGFQVTMQEFLRDQRARVLADIEAALPKEKAVRLKALPDDWWNGPREDNLLGQALHGLYIRLSRTALQVVADQVGKIVMKPQVRSVADKMLDSAGDRITGINETTRDAIAKQLSEGVRRGYSPAQIANGVPHEDFEGIANAAVFDDARAELVARTETMLGYNQSALLGYQEFDVAQVEAIDGDDDEECAERDGQVFDVEEALSIEDHPNGTLDWIPLTDKAAREDRGAVERIAAKALDAVSQPHPAPVIHLHQYPQNVNVAVPDQGDIDITVEVPDQPAPVVNVEPAVVNVEAPTVHVDPSVVTVAAPAVNLKAGDIHVAVPKQPAPVVNVKSETPVVNVTNEVKAPDVNLSLPADLRITSMPDRVTRRVVKRDAKGALTETTDIETDG